MAIVLGVAASLRFLRRRGPLEEVLRVVPFTSSAGEKRQPAFSPDGKELAYSWRGENNGKAKIYVKLVGAGTPLRLTGGPGDDFSPAWSPDGRYIAFWRQVSEGWHTTWFQPWADLSASWLIGIAIAPGYSVG